MSNAVKRAPRRMPVKPARAALVHLSITTDRCPQISLRVLGLLAQRSIIPTTIAQTLRARSLAIDIAFVCSESLQAEILCAKMGELVGVRRVRITGIPKSVALK